METERRYIMDFLIGRTVIETATIDDLFIHDDEYWKNMKNKEKLASDNGFDFWFVDEFTDLNTLRILKDQEMEIDFSSLYKEGEICVSNYNLKPERNSVDKRRIHFALRDNGNIAMVGYMKVA